MSRLKLKMCLASSLIEADAQCIISWTWVAFKALWRRSQYNLWIVFREFTILYTV